MIFAPLPPPQSRHFGKNTTSANPISCWWATAHFTKTPRFSSARSPSCPITSSLKSSARAARKNWRRNFCRLSKARTATFCASAMRNFPRLTVERSHWPIPSRYEGFGLPIFEAQKCGCPVITCRNSSLAEVAGEAAIYVGDADDAAMRQALLDVQRPELRQKLTAAGQKNVQRFSWTNTGRMLAGAIQEFRPTGGRPAAASRRSHRHHPAADFHAGRGR